MKRLTLNLFIDRARKSHGSEYDYSKAHYKNNRTPVLIRCNQCGSEFWQRPDNHISGCGCPYCSSKRNYSTEEWIERARRVHGDKYDYSKVEYVKAHDKIDIICPIHGLFQQSSNNHLRGKGCPKCGEEKVGFVNSLTHDEFVSKAIVVHGTKYDYSKVDYVNNRRKIHIICNRCGHVFKQSPSAHLRGEGCPKCAHLDSSYEEYLNDKLNERFNNSDILREYDEDERYPFRCDFYIKSLDLFIEINGYWTHGEHWFDENNKEDIRRLIEWENKGKGLYKSAVETWTKRDVEKREHARKNNLNYVVLWNKEDIDSWINQGYPVRQDWK